jgi:hypothetical protein
VAHLHGKGRASCPAILVAITPPPSQPSYLDNFAHINSGSLQLRISSHPRVSRCSFCGLVTLVFSCLLRRAWLGNKCTKRPCTSRPSQISIAAVELTPPAPKTPCTQHMIRPRRGHLAPTATSRRRRHCTASPRDSSTPTDSSPQPDCTPRRTTPATTSHRATTTASMPPSILPTATIWVVVRQLPGTQMHFRRIIRCRPWVALAE